MAGVSLTGFIPKTLTDVKAELEAAVLSAFGASFDVTPSAPMGQLIGIFSERAAEIWDAQEQNYAAFTRDGATGQSLDNVGALTGTPRLPPKPSTVVATLSGSNGTVVPEGTVFAVAGTGTQFKTQAAVTISGGTATVTCESVDNGPKIAAAGTLTTIVNPVAGLSSVTNSLDATLGRDLESDAAYRLRQETELRASGKGSVGAIQDSLVQVTDVAACTVFENPTDITDGDGLPPHSIECLVTGGADADVRAAIFDEKPAGIQTYGTVTGTVTDEQGITHTIKFSRPTSHNLYAVLDIIVDPLKFPADGVNQVKAALVAWALQTLTTGRDVVASLLSAQAFTVGGVLDAPPAKIGYAPSPVTTTTIVNSPRDIAVADTSRITVNVTNGTP